ncbi:MAG: nickel-dependent lactate racemase [Anaerolineales bacterium]|nr:nickel-dependent lactate racemase [Chloroflexota bacterium]MBL6982650.1 nickel-dependent lactate racemase [Anaerolineales bacterium]
MEIQVPYGRTHLTFEISDRYPVDVIDTPPIPAAKNPLDEVHRALDNLLGEVGWSDFAGAKTVAIAVNDKTRPVPHKHLLPPLMKQLERLGIPNEAITFYVAVGTHPPMTPDEFAGILPDTILNRCKVVSHVAEDDNLLVNLGRTLYGTPIWTNKYYYQSDLKIVVGNIEPHQFVGFSGGVKTAAIGLSGLKSINHNHALMTNPAAQLGTYESNPARQDIEEIGERLGVHLALNAILNQDKNIVHVLAGDPVAVMRSGMPLSRNSSQVTVSAKYPLLITSPGGYPKDINVYQAQKAIGHASLITQPGGTIILVASCSQGSGSPHYDKWMIGMTSHEEVIRRIEREGFRIGPHKAFQIARDALKFRLMIYSDLRKNLAQRLLLNPVDDLQTALDSALADLQPGDRIAFMPHAASTIPHI